MRDPQVVGSGRPSRLNFDRLAARANNGVIKRSEVGRFVAENLVKDPNSGVFGIKVATLFDGDLFAFVATIGPALIGTVFGSTEDASRANREFEGKFTKLTGDDNLFGSLWRIWSAFLSPSEQARREQDWRRTYGDRSRLRGHVC
jgi:hypothetical protein